MDKVTLLRISQLHPWIKNDVLLIFQKAWKKGLFFRMSFGFRTPQEQADLYSLGRDKNGKIVDKTKVVTLAKPWSSWHNYGLAFDVVLLDKSSGEPVWDRTKDLNGDAKRDYDQFTEIAKSFGFEWGGDFKTFKDYPHFQKIPMGLTLSKAKSLAFAGITKDGGFVKWA